MAVARHMPLSAMQTADRSAIKPPKSLRDGDANNEHLSWEDAVEEAGKWLGTLRLGRNLDGQTIDLTPHMSTLAAEGHFRTMVLQSVRRKLKKRGAKDVIIPLE